MTVLDLTKEILGVDNARVHGGPVRARHGCVGHCPPPYAMALRPLPARLLDLRVSQSQYISVYLRFRYISD